MPKSTANRPPTAVKDRVKKHREALRARGLRPVTRWVPDTRSPDFVTRYRAQIEALSRDPELDVRELSEWISSVQCTDGWV